MAVVGTFPLDNSADLGDLLRHVLQVVSNRAGALLAMALVTTGLSVAPYMAMAVVMYVVGVAMTFAGTASGVVDSLVGLVTLAALVTLPIAQIFFFTGRLRVTTRVARGQPVHARDFVLGMTRAAHTSVIGGLGAIVVGAVGALAGIAGLAVSRVLALVDLADSTRMLLGWGAFCGAFGLLMIPASYVLMPLMMAMVPAVGGASAWESVRLGFVASRGERVVLAALFIAAGMVLVLSTSVGCIGVPFGFVFCEIALTIAYLAYAPRGSASAAGASGSA